MRKNASRPDTENPEWSETEIRDAQPLMHVLPSETAAAVRRCRGQRGPQQRPTKELISLRVDRDVVAAYRATGAGWQTRANEALKAYAKKSGLAVRNGGAGRRRATPANGARRSASR
jgi:uncharacterized protein (DUF4415 family)